VPATGSTRLTLCSQRGHLPPRPAKLRFSMKAGLVWQMTTVLSRQSGASALAPPDAGYRRNLAGAGEQLAHGAPLSKRKSSSLVAESDNAADGAERSRLRRGCFRRHRAAHDRGRGATASVAEEESACEAADAPLRPPAVVTSAPTGRVLRPECARQRLRGLVIAAAWIRAPGLAWVGCSFTAASSPTGPRWRGCCSEARLARSRSGSSSARS
jgi:hypothetical protein